MYSHSVEDLRAKEKSSLFPHFFPLTFFGWGIIRAKKQSIEILISSRNEAFWNSLFLFLCLSGRAPHSVTSIYPVQLLTHNLIQSLLKSVGTFPFTSREISSACVGRAVSNYFHCWLQCKYWLKSVTCPEIQNYS